MDGRTELMMRGMEPVGQIHGFEACRRIDPVNCVSYGAREGPEESSGCVGSPIDEGGSLPAHPRTRSPNHAQTGQITRRSR